MAAIQAEAQADLIERAAYDAPGADRADPQRPALAAEDAGAEESGAEALDAPGFTLPAGVELPEYDLKALELIYRFKHPKQGLIKKVSSLSSKPFEIAGNVVNRIPGIGKALNLSTSGLVKVLSSGAGSSIRHEALYKKYRRKTKNEVRTLEDIQSLPLEQCDKVGRALKRKYCSMAATEGAGVGFMAGLNPLAAAAAIAADIPTLLGLCLRAIAEYAACYGFDIKDEEEKQFMLYCLNFSTGNSKMSRNGMLSNLTKIARKAMTSSTSHQMQQQVTAQLVKELAEQLGVRVTKQKIAAAIPLAGAFINSGFNALLVNKVCTAAFMLYRERFLARLHSCPELIS
ncbi:MAG: EcsC family protein [Succinivibrio sp.]|nr:EcsC family protein [Succinivibrio sp.]